MVRRDTRRVLMTADTVGGVWTYALDLIEALKPAGVEFALATMGAPLSPAQARAAAKLDNLELYESHFKLEWMRDPWPDVDAAGNWLLELERACRPDVVHLNGYAHAALAFEAKVMVVCHSCVCSWWRAVHGVEAPREWNEYRLRVSRGLAAADVVVGPTLAILREVLACYAVPAATRVIHNARPPGGWRPGVKQPFVLAAGRLWDEAKNLTCLDEAARGLAYPVYVAGPSAQPAGGSVSARHAQLLGQLAPEQLSGWMSRAAIYALPARYEPFGLSVLEAAHAGCALVLGDIPTLRELWDGAAVFVAPHDAGQLRAALTELLERPQQRQRWAARARERAARFSTRRFAEQYSTSYRALSQPRRQVAGGYQEERA